MKRGILAVGVLVLAACSQSTSIPWGTNGTPTPTPGAWWDATWSYRRTLSFDYQGSSDLADVPVLVALNPSRFDYAHAQSGGTDLRFIAGDGTQLPFEVEQWDANGTSILWVRVPALQGGVANAVDLYYGNSSVTTPTQGQVFPGYLGVWHMNQDPSTGGALIQDSSPHGNAGVPMAMAGSALGAAAIGEGLTFDGVDDYIEVDQDFKGTLADHTLSAWVHIEDFSTQRPVFYRLNGEALYPRLWILAGGAVLFQLRINGGTEVVTCGNVPGATTFVVTTFDAAAGVATVYVDGQEACNQAFNPGTVDGGAMTLLLGTDTNSGTWFSGTLDEMRVVPVVRSADWVQAQFRIQRDEASDPFVVFGAEELRP